LNPGTGARGGANAVDHDHAGALSSVKLAKLRMDAV
jgi:hypothetical protein